ncbi:MAG: pyridoxal phosphate-dependent aminotransferase [Clostridia bacterium]|nr:pyridoxal phosphate-dependent aminotransferase [Clostridia bacterium]
MSISKKISTINPSPTLSIDEKVKTLKAAGENVIGFGAGQPDFDTPDYVKDAAIKAIRDGFTKYTPASGTPELKKAICKKLERDNGLSYKPSQIVVSNGAKQALVNAFSAICNPGDEVLVPAPYWVSYPEMIKLADGTPVVVPGSNGFKVTVSDLEAALTEHTKAFILNSPNNPTGLIYTEDEIRALADFAVCHGLYVISDEIYEKLIYDGEKHISIASFGDEIKKRTIIVNGLSKSHSMTGWRIGFTAADELITKAMANMQSHASSNPNSIAQMAALAAYEGNDDFTKMMCVEFLKRRNYMVEKINSIDGVSADMPNGAFYVMMDISKLFGKEFYGRVITNSDEFCEKLLEVAKVGLVPGSGFAAEGYTRLSYATSMENIVEGLDRIEKFIKHEF